MNILVVTQYFWPENFRINDLVAGLTERGHYVTVLTGRPNYPDGRIYNGYGCLRPWRESYTGAQVVRVPLVPRGRGRGPRLALNYLSFALSASVLGPLLVDRRFDAVLAYEPSPITVGIPALAMKMVNGAPLLFWLQDLWPESLTATGAVRSKCILKLVEHMVRLLYKGFDRILIQSKAFSGPVERLGGDSRRIRYFPNSAESFYKPVTPPVDAPERRLMPEGFCLTFAGNIGAAQDFATILDAAQRLSDQSDIHFLIIGDGRMFEWVSRSVDERRLSRNVHLLGRFPAERMPFFFALSHALLVTLHRDPIFSLTIPAKVQSYMACGRPLVAALDGEGARVIETACAGLTCPAEDPARLAQTILAMSRLSKTERRDMGENGRRFFEAEFEREMLLDRLEGWLLEVISPGNLF